MFYDTKHRCECKFNGKTTHVKLKMSDTDMSDIESTINRIPNTISKMSNNNIQMDFDVIKITNPLTSISYDEENEYYIDPKDVKDLIQEYLDKKEYDYIYIATRLGKLNEDKNALVHDWIGLGGMDYYEVGFSNIRLPNNSNSYIYKYDERVNTFPEEVFIHEFLHTLERNEKEYGNNNVANLHDYEKYNYKREDIIGLKNGILYIFKILSKIVRERKLDYHKRFIWRNQFMKVILNIHMS